MWFEKFNLKSVEMVTRNSLFCCSTFHEGNTILIEEEGNDWNCVTIFPFPVDTSILIRRGDWFVFARRFWWRRQYFDLSIFHLQNRLQSVRLSKCDVIFDFLTSTKAYCTKRRSIGNGSHTLDRVYTMYTCPSYDRLVDRQVRVWMSLVNFSCNLLSRADLSN